LGRPSRDVWNLSRFDTSPHQISKLFYIWSEGGEGICPEELFKRLQKHLGLSLREARFQEALERVRTYLRSRDRNIEGGIPNAGPVTLPLFTSLWQRLMLGAVCNQAHLLPELTLNQCDVRLIGYNEKMYNSATMSEEEFLFGGNLRFKNDPRERVACWVRIDRANPDRLVRLGVKFFLHPIATTEAINAATDGATKIDVYWHEYFVSLEIYALSDDFLDLTGRLKEAGEPPRVRDLVSRSTTILVATGNPRRGYRDWLVSIVSESDPTDKPRADLLDRFPCGTTSATQVFDAVMSDLKAHGRMREYQADFLLYSIIDQSVEEVVPICRAYGYRLGWLEEQLYTYRSSLPLTYIDEISNIRLEIQELQQWLGQITSILRHMEMDCKDIREDGVGGAIAWSFGKNVRNQGKSLLLFIRGTQEKIERVKDRLRVLHELAQNFSQKHDRHNEAFMNRTLFILTVATAVFMPAQFLAAVYGMNFRHNPTDGDGSAIPEINWVYGYPLFWILVLGMIGSGSTFAWFHLRQRAKRTN